MEPCKQFIADPRAPATLPPAGSCDAQAHVFGDPAKYPIGRHSAYPQPEGATVQAMLHMHRAIGVTSGVIVQATPHGTNHAVLHDALAVAGPDYRGVAIIDDNVSDLELRRLHESGVRGARFNFWKQLNMVPTPAGFRRALDRIKEYGWFAKFHSFGEEWLDIKDLLDEVRIPAVIDHMGHIQVQKGMDQPALRLLLDLLARENWWIMVSNAHRISAREDIWQDVVPLAQAFVTAAPDRAIWCTDWPHVQWRRRMPDDAELLEFLDLAVPDAETRRRILVENPARLFGLQSPSGSN